MMTSSYLKRPLRKYEDALSDVEKVRAAEAHADAKTKQRVKRNKSSRRTAA